MCSKHCGSIWEPADHSASTYKLRSALVCYTEGRLEPARDLFEQVLSALTPQNSLYAPVERWIKAIVNGRPASQRLITDVKGHVKAALAAQTAKADKAKSAVIAAGRALPKLTPEAVSRLAAELSDNARQGLDLVPAVTKPILRLVVND
jgi:hypothetical protein